MPGRPPLRKIVFDSGVSEERLEELRQAFPDLSIVLARGDALADEIGDAQLVVGSAPSDTALEAASELAWLHVPWAGVESVLTPGLIERGITITNSRGVSAPNMAEHIVAMMLVFGRGFPLLFHHQQERSWRGWDRRPSAFELTGQTVVLLGVGAIGQATALRLEPFGVRTIGARRQADGSTLPGMERVVGFDALPDVLPEADHVVSTLPMTPFTKAILSAELIERFKPGAYFFNVGRGGTVDQDALIEGLRSGRIGGAGLDVTDPEPLPADAPLWDVPNVIITGHTSGSSPLVEDRVYELLHENIRRYMDGRELLNIVDTEAGY